MKKVLISAYVCEPNRGSEAGNGWNWAYYLSQKGYEVHVLTTTRGKEAIDQVIKNDGIKNLHFHFINHSYFWKRAFYWNVVTMYAAYLLWQRKIYRVANALHTEHPFDIVHHVTWGSVKMGTLLYKLNNVKFIYGPVGGGHKAPVKFKRYFYNEWKREWMRNKVGDIFSFINPLTKKTLGKATVVLAANTDTVNYAKKNGAKNVQLILDSALPSAFIPSERSIKNNRTVRFLWVGSMWAFKGIVLVLEAFSKLEPGITAKVQLHVVGGGPFLKKCKEIVTELNLDHIVEIHGALSYNLVKEEYRLADVFIYCSLRDSCPAQYLEAMAFGVPIITLNMNGALDFLNEDISIRVGVDDPAETVKELSAAITKLTVDDSLRNEMSINAYDFALSNTWSTRIDKVVNEFYLD